jgi:hypothetical protein
MDRRQFVLNTAAGVGGTLLFPGVSLAAPGTATYRRTTLRRVGGGLVRIPDGLSRHGDFAAFAMGNGGRVVGPVDLFAVVSAPPGHERDSALTPLGRVRDLTAVRATLTAMGETQSPSAATSPF